MRYFGYMIIVWGVVFLFSLAVPVYLLYTDNGQVYGWYVVPVGLSAFMFIRRVRQWKKISDSKK